MPKVISIRIISYVALFGWMSSHFQSTTLRERIPAYLQQLCPGSGVCLNDIIVPDDNMPSCCGDCSCSEDCETEGNCCFQNKNNNTIEINRLRATRKYSECLYPIVKMKGVAFSYDMYRSYFMTSTSPNDAIINEMTNNTVTCGDTKVAPWGSMFPVYSKRTGEIYKNMVCADEHNVTDGELWGFYISCYEYGTIGFISRFQRGFISDRCVVHFFYEGGMSMLKSHQCYHETYYECTHNNFEIPAFLPVTGEEIVAACESGLVSPYKNLYANIFCYICNTNRAELVESSDCTDGFVDNLAGKGANGIFAFTMIFDASTFSKALIEDHHEDVDSACLEYNKPQNGDKCRRISCPFGKVFTHEDGCIYSGKKWFTSYMLIKISVYAEGTINISNLLRSKKI